MEVLGFFITFQMGVREIRDVRAQKFFVFLFSIPHAREKIILEHELMIERRADM